METDEWYVIPRMMCPWYDSHSPIASIFTPAGLDGHEATLVQNRDGPDHSNDWTRRSRTALCPESRLRSSPTHEPTRTIYISIVALASVVITNKKSYQTVGI